MGFFNRLNQEFSDSRINRRGASSGSWEGPFDIGIQESGKTQRFQRGLKPEQVEEFNKKIQAWGSKVTEAMGPSISSYGIGGKSLRKSIRNNYYYEYGEIYRIGFSFRREGIFVHKGVGRGYVMQGGVVVKTAKTSGFNRKPKPWFNPVIEAHVPELEQIVKEYAEDAILNTVRIYIR